MKRRRQQQQSRQTAGSFIFALALMFLMSAAALAVVFSQTNSAVSASTITVYQPLGTNSTNSTYYSYDTLMIDWSTDVSVQNESLYNVWLLSAQLPQPFSPSDIPPIFLILDNGLPRVEGGGYDYVIEPFIPSGEYWIRVASAAQPLTLYGDSQRFNITRAIELKPPNPWWIWVLLAFVLFGCCANYLCQCVSCWSRIVCEMLADR